LSRWAAFMSKWRLRVYQLQCRKSLVDTLHYSTEWYSYIISNAKAGETGI
jgi:hypothetical protein